MLYYDLPIYRDTYRLVQNLYALTSEFPKQYRYSLGTDLCAGAKLLVRYIYLANKDKQHRKSHLEIFDQTFETLKLDLRLSVDFKCITFSQMSQLNVLIETIGKQAKGWERS